MTGTGRERELFSRDHIHTCSTVCGIGWKRKVCTVGKTEE
jgi:hypothetical protein